MQHKVILDGCSHRGDPVAVGPHEIRAGGSAHLVRADLFGLDVVVQLNDYALAVPRGVRVIRPGLWPDFGPPPPGFREFLWNEVIPLLREGKVLLVHCTAGHGRTGTFLAALVALLEDVENPIAVVRKRYCELAVETEQQAAFVASLRK